MNNYYIYFHINPLKNEVFYVGKGKDKRAWSNKGRSLYWKRITNKYGYIIDIVENNLTEQEAFEREIFYISKIGRKDLKKGSLVNMTNGGDGSSGYIHKPEAINKMSNSKIGRKLSDDVKEKISKAGKGKKRTEETKIKMSECKKGDKNPSFDKGNRYIFDGILYTSLNSLWRELFSDIHINTFRYRVEKNKIQGLINLHKNNLQK